MVIHL